MIEQPYVIRELLILALALGWWLAAFLRRHRR